MKKCVFVLLAIGVLMLLYSCGGGSTSGAMSPDLEREIAAATGNNTPKTQDFSPSAGIVTDSTKKIPKKRNFKPTMGSVTTVNGEVTIQVTETKRIPKQLRFNHHRIAKKWYSNIQFEVLIGANTLTMYQTSQIPYTTKAEFKLGKWTWEKLTPKKHGEVLESMSAHMYNTLQDVFEITLHMKDHVVYACTIDDMYLAKSQSPVYKNTALTYNNTHVVQSGESLKLIARKYGTNWQAIKRVNNLQSTTISPGQILKLPK